MKKRVRSEIEASKMLDENKGWETGTFHYRDLDLYCMLSCDKKKVGRRSPLFSLRKKETQGLDLELGS